MLLLLTNSGFIIDDELEKQNKHKDKMKINAISE